jgi:hypothetical protein
MDVDPTASLEISHAIHDGRPMQAASSRETRISGIAGAAFPVPVREQDQKNELARRFQRRPEHRAFQLETVQRRLAGARLLPARLCRGRFVRGA